MKKVIGILLAALLLLTCLPLTALADPAKIGTATVSIVDNGDRDALKAAGTLTDADIQYATPFGTIVEPTAVDVYEGDTAADVLVRLFEMKGIAYNAWGTTEIGGGFYLTDITFTKDGETVANFGGGSITPDNNNLSYYSGWMAKLNNWFTSSGLSDYLADDGDIIELLYTCTVGADIGNDWNDATAAFTGITASAGTLSPAFSADVKAYTLTVDADTDSVKLAAANKNYASVVTYTVGEVSYKYMRAIPVTDGTVITVNSKYYSSTWDNEVGGYVSALADEDEITITVVKAAPAAPDEPAGEKSILETISETFSTIFNFLKSIIRRIGEFFTALTGR